MIERVSRLAIVGLAIVLLPNIACAYYAAHLGRWTSRDPFGEVGRAGVEFRPNPGTNDKFLVRDTFNPLGAYHDGMNLYQYVRSSPIQHLDPSGLSGYCSDDCPQRSPGLVNIASYGCYCGPGSQPGPGGRPPNPIDPVDGACTEHDDCYGANGCVAGAANPSPACQKCDEDFCRRLKTSTCNRYGAGTPEYRTCEQYRRAAMGAFNCQPRFNTQPPKFPIP